MEAWKHQQTPSFIVALGQKKNCLNQKNAAHLGIFVFQRVCHFLTQTLFYFLSPHFPLPFATLEEERKLVERKSLLQTKMDWFIFGGLQRRPVKRSQWGITIFRRREREKKRLVFFYGEKGLDMRI